MGIIKKIIRFFLLINFIFSISSCDSINKAYGESNINCEIKVENGDKNTVKNFLNDYGIKYRYFKIISNDKDSVFFNLVCDETNLEKLKIIDDLPSNKNITFTDSNGNVLMEGKDVLKDTDGAILSYDNGRPIVLLNIKNPTLFGEKTDSIAGQNMVAWIGYEPANPDTGYIGDFAAYNGEGTKEEYYVASKKVIFNATVNEKIESENAIISGIFTELEAIIISKFLSEKQIDFTIIND